jgi:hypothetical protein
MSIIVLPNLNVPEDAPSVASAGGGGTSADEMTTIFTAAAVPESKAPPGTSIAIAGPEPEVGTLNVPPDEGRITVTSSADNPAGTITGTTAGSVGIAVGAGVAGGAATFTKIVLAEAGICDPLPCTAYTEIVPVQPALTAVNIGVLDVVLSRVPQAPEVHV